MAKLKLNQQIFDLIYPVGSVYLTVNDINPQTLFGGTWVKSSGGFIYGSTATGTKGENGNGTGTSVSSAGGGNTGSTTLNINQIPGHTHWFGWSTHASQYSSDVNENYNRSFATDTDEGTMLMAHWCFDGNERIGYTSSEGGSQGHTHPLSNHSHNIPYFACYIWKRTA